MLVLKFSIKRISIPCRKLQLSPFGIVCVNKRRILIYVETNK